MNNVFMLGVELMIFGLIGVFSTLIAFMAMIWALRKIFPAKD